MKKTISKRFVTFINLIRITELIGNPELREKLRRLNRQISPRGENDLLAVLGYLDRDFMSKKI